MEVIVDTNVFMDAIFDQLNNEDCWQILYMVRRGDIIPVVSEGLFKEYVFVPAKICINSLKGKFEDRSLGPEDFDQASHDVYECCSTIMKIMTERAKHIKVTSRCKICPDSEDDKIINLAIDSDCHNIITKNISDLKCAEEAGTKTKSGKLIEVDTPENFLKLFNFKKRTGKVAIRR